jgi:hypothetical protein
LSIGATTAFASAPELVAAVEQGIVGVSGAADVAIPPKNEQREIAARSHHS